MRVSSSSVFRFFLVFCSLILVGNLIFFDNTLNRDYINYLSNYEFEWRQFDRGYEALVQFSRSIGFSYDQFYALFLVCQLIAIFLIYKNGYVILFALPNLVYLSQGMLATQYRFGLAALLSVFLLVHVRKISVYLALVWVPLSLHVGVIGLALSSLWAKWASKKNYSILNIKVILSLSMFVAALGILSFLLGDIYNYFGYYYYVGTRYDAGRSLSGLVYIVASLGMLFFFMLYSKSIQNSALFYTSIFVLLIALILAQSSVLSGRYTLIYLLLEPFLFVSYIKVFENIFNKIFVALILLLFSSTKLININLIL